MSPQKKNKEIYTKHAGQKFQLAVGFTYTDSHTGELAVELGNDLTDGLGGTGRGGDKVGQGGTSRTPILATLGRSVNDQLVGGTGVDGGHEAFDDTKLVIDDLCERGQTVGCAGCVGQDRGTSVSGVVYAHDVHGSIAGGGRNDNLLGTTLEMGGGLGGFGENTGGLADNFGTFGSPSAFFGVTAGKELDPDITNDEAVTIGFDFTFVHSVDGIILELVGGVLNSQKGVIDCNDSSIGVLQCGTANQTTDTAESVDTKLDHDCERIGDSLKFEASKNESLRLFNFMRNGYVCGRGVRSQKSKTKDPHCLRNSSIFRSSTAGSTVPIEKILFLYAAVCRPVGIQ